MSKTPINLSIDDNLKRIAFIEGLKGELSSMLEEAIKDRLSHKYDFNNGYAQKPVQHELDKLKEEMRLKEEELKTLQRQQKDQDNKKTKHEAALDEERKKIREGLRNHGKNPKLHRHPQDLAPAWREVFNSRHDLKLNLKDYKRLIDEVEAEGQ